MEQQANGGACGKIRHTSMTLLTQSKSVAKIQVREANHTLQHEGQSS